jgi:hypothetical protein
MEMRIQNFFMLWLLKDTGKMSSAESWTAMAERFLIIMKKCSFSIGIQKKTRGFSAY